MGRGTESTEPPGGPGEPEDAVEPAPVDTPPVEAAPLDTPPAEAAPVEATPAGTTSDAFSALDGLDALAASRQPARPDWWTSRAPDDYTPTLRPDPVTAADPAPDVDVAFTTEHPDRSIVPQINRRLTIGLVAATGVALLLGFALLRDGGADTGDDDRLINPVSQAIEPDRRTGFEGITLDRPEEDEPVTPDSRPRVGHVDPATGSETGDETFGPVTPDSTVDDGEAVPSKRTTTTTPRVTVAPTTSPPSSATTQKPPTTTTTSPSSTTTTPTTSTTTTTTNPDVDSSLLRGVLGLIVGG